MRGVLDSAEGSISSDMTYLETRSALARMRKGGRLSPSDHALKLRDFESGWVDVATVAVSSALVHSAVQYAEDHSLRAYDALHLASAASVRSERLAFVCWDQELRRAAATEGLRLIPG